MVDAESPRRVASKGVGRRTSKAASRQGNLDWDAKAIEDFVLSNGGIVAHAEEDGITRTSAMIPLRAAREG